MELPLEIQLLEACQKLAIGPHTSKHEDLVLDPEPTGVHSGRNSRFTILD